VDTQISFSAAHEFDHRALPLWAQRELATREREEQHVVSGERSRANRREILRQRDRLEAVIDIIPSLGEPNVSSRQSVEEAIDDTSLSSSIPTTLGIY
jgi:hypothetical protein